MLKSEWKGGEFKEGRISDKIITNVIIFIKYKYKCKPTMNMCSKFHPNGTIGKCSKSGGRRGEKFKNKVQTSQLPFQNERSSIPAGFYRTLIRTAPEGLAPFSIM